MQQETDGTRDGKVATHTTPIRAFSVPMVKAIVTGKCQVCGCPFLEDQLINCVGMPYMIILHETCSPFFPYSKGVWPHPMPLDYYTSMGTVYK